MQSFSKESFAMALLREKYSKNNSFMTVNAFILKEMNKKLFPLAFIYNASQNVYGCMCIPLLLYNADEITYTF